jgi:hypothetical protein
MYFPQFGGVEFLDVPHVELVYELFSYKERGHYFCTLLVLAFYYNCIEIPTYTLFQRRLLACVFENLRPENSVLEGMFVGVPGTYVSGYSSCICSGR